MFRTLALLAIAGIVGAGSLLGVLWLEHRSETILPAPTGRYMVGRAIDDWTDDHAADTLAPVPGTRRELLVWMWYPAAAQPAAVMEEYVPAASLAASTRLRSRAIPALLMRDVFTRDLSRVRVHSMRDARVASQERSYPVLILRGGASAPVAAYTTLAEDLASHGYVVVGFDAPYRTSAVAFPDGRTFARAPGNNPELCEGQPAGCIDRLLAAWIADIGFAVDRLERLNAGKASGRFSGRLDMTRLGVFGHSFGGAQAAQFCHDDLRCKAGVDIDGMPFGSVVHDGLQQPFMFLLSGQIHRTDPESRRVSADIQSIYDHQPAGRRMRIAIRRANHFLFSDDGALLKSHLVMGALRAAGLVGIDGRRQLAVTAYAVRSFFDAYLKPSGRTPVHLDSRMYPEIEVLE